jgi:ketosteroid isomerase-like protein
MKSVVVLFSLLILLFISNLTLAQETIILQDMLQGSTSAGSQVGGSFTSEGYKPGRSENHILYTVPQQVQNGYVEVEIKGFNFSDFSTTVSEQLAFFIMYDGRGIPEPVVWANDYRSNFFRWEVTYRGERPDLPGAGNRFKGKMHTAPQDAPLYQGKAIVPTVTGTVEDNYWNNEPNGLTATWDPNRWYKIKAEWNNSTSDFRIYRDGVEYWHNKKNIGVPFTGDEHFSSTSPYPWLPQIFRIWLGSGPAQYSQKMPNMVFRNFKVVSTGAIQNTAPVIISSAVTSASTGQLYSYDVNATGYPTPTYSLSASPSGMTINSTTGLINWTPGSTGNFGVTVRAANGISPDATQSFTINVQASQNSAPNINSVAVISGFVGQLYSYDVNASGNPSPTYSLTASPQGMSINSTTGLISWTPAAVGNFAVTVKAANGISPDASQSFTINVTEAPPCPVGVISYWKLDEVSGSTYADYMGLNNASSTNTPSPTSGKVNGAQLFNGSSSKITIPVNAIYNWSANSSFSLEAWIKHVATTFTVNENIVGRKDNSNSLSIKLDVTPQIKFGVRSKTGESFSVSGPNVYDNTWHHVVGVKDGNLNQLRLYVDGVLVSAISASFSSGFDSPTAPFTIGWKDLTGDESYFEGSIDEVAIYSIALDAAAISQHYNNGIQNKGYCNEELTNTAPAIVSSAVSSASVGQLYTYDVNATGSPTPTYSLTASPQGMSINSTTGLISWTPLTAGSFNVSVKAVNGIAPDASQAFTINVAEVPQCPSGLLSYWKLDETSGSTYADYVGTNNATSTNAPTPTTGRVNGGKLFNGTSNGIIAPRIAAYDFGTNTSFTFEAWIKHSAGSYVSEEVAVERKSASSSLAINLKFNYTRAISFSVRNTASEIFVATGSTVLYDNNWHHIVGVRDAAANQLRVYVDGILESTVSAVYTAGFTSATEGISIGWRSSAGTNYFNGTIDEVAIYNTALDAATISKHYNNGLLNLGFCETAIAPQITSSPVSFALVNQLYEYDVEAVGNPSPSYSFITSPNGMTINSTTGMIAWTPTSAGNFSVGIRASNGVNPEATQSFEIIVKQPLFAPTNLTAVASQADSHNVKLTWQDNSSNELGFIIERKTGDSLSLEPYSIIDSVLADVSMYEDTSVADTTKYTYRVYAFNDDTLSDYSNQAEVVTPVPVELTSFSANISNQKVLLVWETATEMNNSGFTIQRGKEPYKLNDIAFIPGKGTTTSKSFYSYLDQTFLIGRNYYRLKQVDLDGSVNYSNIVTVDLGSIENFVLEQNYPNPFNPSTTIRFGLPKSAKVIIKLHNSIGQEVATLLENDYESGIYETSIDASNLSSGVYFYKLQAIGADGSKFNSTKRMILLK